MALPYVYADFNGLRYVNDDHSEAILLLTGYGTLASLARQRIRLAEGLRLVFFEPTDIECEGVAHFEASIADPAGRAGSWVARIKCEDIRDCAQAETGWDHPCIECGTDFVKAFGRIGGNYREDCPACGTSVMAPMAPPVGL